MKSIKRNIKWAAYILSFMILIQSCTVYHKYNSSVDEAIATENKVKLDVENNNPYKFQRLVRIDGEIFGLARHESNTFEFLSSRKTAPSEYQKSSFVQVYDNEINDIHLKNKTASTVISVAIPAVVLGVILIPILNNPLDPYGTND